MFTKNKSSKQNNKKVRNDKKEDEINWWEYD